MNNILVTESLYLLTHAANEENTIKQELLFSSTNRNMPGQAYEISISDNNTGYSDLTFKMPTHIINKDGEQEYNPKLALIKPLSKVRYNRIISDAFCVGRKRCTTTHFASDENIAL